MSAANSPISSIDGAAAHPIGHEIKKRNSAGKVLKYRYVYNAGADSLVAGELVGFSQTTPAYGFISGTAADIVDGSSTCNVTAGMAVSAIPTTKYGWIQTEGPNSVAITTDGNVAAGSSLTMGGGASPDGTAIPFAAGTEEMIFGTANAADSSTTSAVDTIYLACIW
jgi:hypothetical protein